MAITGNSRDEAPAWLAMVAEQVRALRFGVVQIVVHDARVVQIERTEKVRVPPPEPGSSTLPGHWQD